MGLMPSFALGERLNSSQINLVFTEGKIINKMIFKDYLGTYYHVLHQNKFHVCIAWNEAYDLKPDVNCYNSD